MSINSLNNSMKLNRLLSILLTSEQGCRYAKICSALLIVLTLLTFVSMTTSWWADAKLASPSPGMAETLKDLSTPLTELSEVVQKAHLFGYHPQASAAMPVTSSELHLMGIIQVGTQDEGADNTASKAIVSANGGVGKVYQVGAIFPNGIKLNAIHPDSIVLDNGGHLERLPLQRKMLEKK